MGACTMIEVDPLRLNEDRSLNDDPLPRMTDQQIMEAENLLADDHNPVPIGLLQTFEEPQIPDDIVAPPVKPRNGSNPRIDVTPAPDLQDQERTPKRTAAAPIGLEEHTIEDGGIQVPPPDAEVADLTEDLVGGSRVSTVIETTEGAAVIEDVVIPPTVAVHPPDEAVIQPPHIEENDIPAPPVANGSDSLELSSLSPEERPKKRRKLGF